MHGLRGFGAAPGYRDVGKSQDARQGRPVQAPLPHHPAIDEEHRDTEVELGEEHRISVHVPQPRLDAERPQVSQGPFAEVAAGASDQFHLHTPTLPSTARGRDQAVGTLRLCPGWMEGSARPLARSISSTLARVSAFGYRSAAIAHSVSPGCTVTVS